MTACPSNFQQWIAEHRCQPKPPVGNQPVFKVSQKFITMVVVGGLKARKYYQLDAGGKLVVQPDDAGRSCNVCGTYMAALAPVLD